MAALDSVGIPYLVTGSIASSLQGEPRATHDVDLVVLLPQEAVPALLAAFPEPDYFLDEESVREAIRHKDMFNLIDLRRGDKADFWMLTESPFDAARLARRIVQEALGMRLTVSAPEDTILAKLRWARLSGGSEKQLRDARRVYEVQHGVLDQAYLDRWAGELGIADLLERIRDEAEVL